MEMKEVEDNVNTHIDYITLGVFDIDGIFRGKKISSSKLNTSIEKGIGFSDVVFGWDITDSVYDNSDYSTQNTGFADVPVIADTHTKRPNIFGNNEPLMIGEFAGRLASCCPRRLLRSIVEKYNKAGLYPKVSCELEFMLIDETAKSLKEKKYIGIEPVMSAQNAYSVMDSPEVNSYINSLLSACKKLDINIESLHPESGIGVLEVALKHADALQSADNGSLFKLAAKFIAMRFGWIASFMSKLSSRLPGQGGHIHVSLTDMEGKSLFYSDSNPHKMNQLMCYFINGVLKTMPEFMCLSVPTVNGYKRLVPEYWAPNLSNCGIEDRTCSIRVIGDTETSLHIEYRLPGADMNPYIAISSLLGAGLWGIENQVDSGFEFSSCGEKVVCAEPMRLCTSLEEATGLLEKSEIAKELFGNAFINHYVKTRHWEYMQSLREVSSWEIERYLERI
jgi:glutamine synthetase